MAVLALLVALMVALLACSASADAFSRSQARYLQAANKGVKKTHRWWNHGRHWYSSVLGGSNVASLWGVVPLFEALAGCRSPRRPPGTSTTSTASPGAPSAI